jgi:hypothetical protein
METHENSGPTKQNAHKPVRFLVTSLEPAAVGADKATNQESSINPVAIGRAGKVNCEQLE